MKPISVVQAIAGVLTIVTLVSANDVVLHENSVVQFASEAQGQATLAARDRYLKTLSPFDRQSRLETDKEVSEAEFVEFVRSHVRPWTDAERTKVTAVIESLRAKLMKYRLPFPQKILLIKTTGREEGSAAYCREDAVVLPQRFVNFEPQDLERLLTHELFHILSSHDPEFRAKCYKVIGFQVVDPIEFPESLRARKLTNPDGPLLDAVIGVSVDGESRKVVPILYADRPFDPARGGPFFKYLTFRLLVLEARAGGWRAAEQNGAPWLLDPEKIADYGRQIGANTGYTIHPDEVLADNFVHLVYQTPNLRSPQIVEGLARILKVD